MDKYSKLLLISGSVGHFVVALLHYVMPFMGSWAYGFFGAPELTTMALEGSSVPAIATFGIAGVFTVFGLAGLSCAGVLRFWKGVRIVLWIVGVVYLLRGFAVIVELSAILTGESLPLRHALYSLVALIIGIVQLWGLWRSRSTTSPTDLLAA